MKMHLSCQEGFREPNLSNSVDSIPLRTSEHSADQEDQASTTAASLE